MTPNLPDVPYAQLDYRSEQLRTDFSAARTRRRRSAARAPRARLTWVRRALPVHRHA